MDNLSKSGHSFEACCVPLRSELLGYAYKMTRNRAQAEDIVQASMLRSLMAWPEWSPRGDLEINPALAARAWMYRIVQNRFRNTMRYEKGVRLAHVDRLHDILENTYGGTDYACQPPSGEVEPIHEVRRALRALRKTWRDFIRRRYYLGETNQEIAEASQKYTVSTVSSGISRGLKRMKPILARYARANYGLGCTRANPQVEAVEVVQTELWPRSWAATRGRRS